MPASGDYTITVGGTRGNAEYALTITIDQGFEEGWWCFEQWNYRAASLRGLC